ncbi:MAG: MFS transporter, partial [Thermomicrobiales bacterium]
IGFFSAGINQGFGVFIKPMIDDFGWSRADISLSISIFAIMSAIIPPFAGRISDRYGPRSVLTVGVALNALGMVLMATANSLVEIYIFYGVLIGAGFGFTGIAATTALLSRWFIRRRGLALSIGATGLGAGQLLLAPLTTMVIIQFSWQTAFVVVGVASALLIPPVFLLLKRAAPDDADEIVAVSAEPRPAPDCITNEMIRADMNVAWGSRSFWMLASGFMACGFTIFFLTAHLVPLATDAGISAQQAGIALGLTGGTSIIANLGIAAISDRVSRKYILAGLYAMRGVSILMLFNLSGATMLYAAALLFGLSRSNAPVVSASIIDLFGRRAVGSLVGTLFMYHQFFAAAGAFFGGLIYDQFGSYNIMLVIAFVSMINATAASLFIREPSGAIETPVLAEPAVQAASAD